jgi:hypothetical protein
LWYLPISITYAQQISSISTRSAHRKAPRPLLSLWRTAITLKGTRRKKIEIVQLWRCASCKRVFTPMPAALRNKTYPRRVVLDAITPFDLGYTLETAVDKIRARHGYRVGRSTIAAWLAKLADASRRADDHPPGARRPGRG